MDCAKTDLLFILDTSGSVEDRFVTERDLLLEIVDAIPDARFDQVEYVLHTLPAHSYMFRCMSNWQQCVSIQLQLSSSITLEKIKQFCPRRGIER